MLPTIFQSTLPREERLRYRNCDSWTNTISIHAPTRGATNTLAVSDSLYVFQSTLPREERRLCLFRYANSSRFQSTLPREERPYQDSNPYYYFYFNPRSHERSDYFREYTYFCFMISIHAPTRGATEIRSFMRRRTENFNPRSHERSDAYIALNPTALKDFNPRSHERSDKVCFIFIR